MIHQIIEKAWEQPKYASTYATICLIFSKKEVGKFKFGGAEKANPFKHFLVEEVQHSFDKKAEIIPIFADEGEKEVYFKEYKKKILGNIKFIA